MSKFVDLLKECESTTIQSDVDIILEGQYLDAYNTMMDAWNAGLYVGLIGPVGSGKTSLCRKFAVDLGRPFEWVTFSDLVRPSNLIGSFDPTLVFKLGYCEEAFNPGPFSLAALQGGVFLANELNRGDEYVLNSLLDTLEERKLYIPSLKKWYDVEENFYMIAAMNPSEVKGTRNLPSAVKDRIKVWIELGYPTKAIESRIMQSHCSEYSVPASQIELILDLVHETRTDPAVDTPASIRSSIGLVRLAAQKARRLDQEVTNQLLAQSAVLTLGSAINLKPGRDLDGWLKKLLKRILGTSGK